VDATNDDTSRRRNRIRHQVLPALVAVEGPALVEVLARTADIAASDEEFLRQHAEEAWRRVVVSLGPPLRLNPAALAQEPEALATRVLMRAIAHVAGRTPSFAQVTSARRWLERGVPGRLALSGAVAELSVAQGVLLTRGPDTRQSASARRFAAWQHTLTVPGEVAVPEAGGRLRARIDGQDTIEPGSLTAVRVAHAVVGDRLVVRSWQPGDRVRPGGDFGRKKVQDLFVDRKVPRADRHRVPIVAAPDGRIVWVAGHAVSREFRATSATKSVVVLSFEPLGGC
jgi:tRNA(Ile)-lysidine synthase